MPNEIDSCFVGLQLQNNTVAEVEGKWCLKPTLATRLIKYMTVCTSILSTEARVCVKPLVAG